MPISKQNFVDEHFNFVLFFSNDWLYSTNRFDITFYN